MRTMLGLNEPHAFSQINPEMKLCAVCGNDFFHAVHNPAFRMAREQVGGDHYRTPMGIPEHWDLAWALNWDFFQYQITKYIWRWKDKGGVADLEKAQHFLKKYIDLLGADAQKAQMAKAAAEIGAQLGAAAPTFDTGEPQGRGYVDQDQLRPGLSVPTSADAPPVASGRGGIPNHLAVIDEHGRRHDYKRIT